MIALQGLTGTASMNPDSEISGVNRGLKGTMAAAWLQGVRQAGGRAQETLSKLASQAAETVRGFQGSAVTDVTRNSLASHGVNVEDFEWLVPIDRLVLRDGRVLESGSAAKDNRGTLHIFRHTPTEGFQLASSSQERAMLEVEASSNGKAGTTLSLVFPPETGVTRAEASLTDELMTAGEGPWIDAWRQQLSSQQGIAIDELFVADVESLCPDRSRFGIVPCVPKTLTFVQVAANRFRCLPPLKLPALSSATACRQQEAGFEVLHSDGGVPQLVRMTLRDGQCREAFNAAAGPCLGGISRAHEDLMSRISECGVFRVVLPNDTVVSDEVLQLAAGGIICCNSPAQRPLTHFAQIDETTVLTNAEGDCLALADCGQLDEAAKTRLTPLTELAMLTQQPDAHWTVLCSHDPQPRPCFFRVDDDTFSLGSMTKRSLDNAFFRVETTGKDELRVLCVEASGQKHRLVASEHIAYSVLREVNVRQAARRVSQAKMAELYSEYNEVKSSNFLLMLFGDIMVLNRRLDNGIAMDHLMSELEDVGAAKFLDSAALRDATVGKIMLLLAGLGPIKQKFELLATMSPYYWLKQEVQWLAAAFGTELASKPIATERKRLVPTVRRQIRTVQADILRSLAPIEAAARPLDAIFAREELRLHWSSLGRRATPAIQALLGAGLFVSGVVPAFMLIGAGVQGANAAFSYFGKNPEAAAQVQRAADVIFPWWKIFMKTLAVAIYESRECAAEWNTAAMKRDKQMLESLPAATRPAAIKNIQRHLRERIMKEKALQCSAFSGGAGIRVYDLMQDLNQAGGEDMKKSIDAFAFNLLCERN